MTQTQDEIDRELDGELYDEDDAREYENRLEEMRDHLDSLLEDDKGRCDQCEVASINGTRCHELGCENQAKIADLTRAIQRYEEDGY